MYQNRLWYLAVLASFCFISTWLQAAQPPGDRDLARERQQRLLQEQQQRLGGADVLSSHELRMLVPLNPG